jgi:proteasome accessory factor C
VFIDEGTVFAGVPRVFTRPLRLTAPEGFALLAAGRAAMELPGADPEGALGRALAKLATVLGAPASPASPAHGDVSAVVVDLPRPPATDDVSAAVADRARLHISYWTPARDEMSDREITPRAVFADGGHWYVVADDHRSGEERVFRLDRVEAWERTGAVDAPRAVEIPASGSWFADDPDLEVATLRLRPAARWIVERYPMRSVAEQGAVTVVELAVTNERWLARLLVRLGPDAELVGPPRWRGLAAEQARRLLARYDAAAS